MSKIEEARRFAKKAHEEQTRYGGKPYYTHPFRIAEAISKLTNDEDIIIAAYLHDVIEDTEITCEQIKDRFGEKVAGYVFELTVDENGNFSNLESEEALAIKCIDRAHNVLTLKTIPDKYSKKREELTEKYKRRTKF